jgi:hypothetical protein
MSSVVQTAACYASRGSFCRVFADFGLRSTRIAGNTIGNKTRQGYARKRTLKPAGYFFVEGR